MSTSAFPPPPDDATGSPPQDTRDAVRRAARARRSELSDEDHRRAAAGCAAQLVGLDRFAVPGTLATYLPIDGEIDPNQVLPALRDRGWDVTVPVVGPDRSMRFVRWDRDATMERNRFGIDEPAAPHRSVPPSEIDVVLVPCVALDRRGNRLGFGAGFYDRAFARTTDPDATTPPRRAVLVGVVHDVQLVEQIDPDAWDVSMDLIVTGTTIIVPSG